MCVCPTVHPFLCHSRIPIFHLFNLLKQLINLQTASVNTLSQQVAVTGVSHLSKNAKAATDQWEADFCSTDEVRIQ